MDPTFLHSGALMRLSDNQLAIGWGEQRWLKEADQEAPFSFYFPDYFLKTEKPWLCFEKTQVTSIEALLHSLPTASADPLTWEPADDFLFEWQCADLFQHFERGELTKGVPYAFERSAGPFTQGQLICSLRSALQLPHNLYGFWNEQEGILGATPELLFRQSEGKVQTAAVAGTTILPTWDQKLLAEHEIVVHGITESLSPFGSIVRGETTLVPFTRFSHLVTPLELSLTTPSSFEQLVRALHPTPALGAYPKKGGWSWLQEVQKLLDRRRYGAPVGIKAETAMHCYVGIRNVQWNQAEAMLGAGCGVIAESNVESEWKELQMKLKSIKEIFAL